MVSLKPRLISRGVSLEAVEVSGTDSNVIVTIESAPSGGPDSVWIRALVEQEMNRLRSAGATDADWVTVNIVDQDGRVLLDTQQPVEACAPPAPGTVDSAKSATVAAYLADQAQVGSVVVKDFEMALNGQDVVATVLLVVDSGAKRDAELRFVVRDLLPLLRSKAEKELQIPVVLYRISMRSSDGAALVEYVVDTSRNSVRAWMADGIRPVWSDTEPFVGNAAD